MGQRLRVLFSSLFSSLFSFLFKSHRNLSVTFIVVGLLCLPFADLEIYQVDPWQELSRMGQGIMQPSFPELSILADSVMITVAFALIAVSGAAFLGLILALFFHSRSCLLYTSPSPRDS